MTSLFSVAQPGAGEADFLSEINPDSCRIVQGWLEPSLAGLPAETRLQTRGLGGDQTFLRIAFATAGEGAPDIRVDPGDPQVQRALLDTGYQVTPVIDRDYFWAIYFRTPGGILFEVATNEPGFDRDEDRAHLGEALKLPSRYQPFRDKIEAHLPPITD